MSAAKLTLPIIEKGATYRHVLYWKDCTYETAVANGYVGTEQSWNDSTSNAIVLTGCTAKLQVRESAEASVVILELSTVNQGIVITPTTGKIALYVSDDISTALVGTGGVYDLEIYFPNGETTRSIEGKVVFKDEVTR